MSRPVFLDLDNTLLDNDAAKAALVRRVAAAVPADVATRFWELYEIVRADEDYIDFTRKTVAGLAPWTGRGVYVNMLNFDEQDRVVEALGGPEKYAELARLKARYDPANLFRMNANILPAA